MAGHGRRSRYGVWSGGPDPLAPPHDVRAAVDQIGREVLAGAGLGEALRQLLRGGPAGDRGGLDDLADRARRLRREALRRGRLDGPLTRARALLDQALAAERDALAGRADDDARFAEARLDSLPRSVAQAVQDLAGYDWASEAARADYRRILDELRDDVLQQRFTGLRDALRSAGPQPPGASPVSGSGSGSGSGSAEQNQELVAMLQDLNDLLAQHARGQDTTDQFAGFMERHGEFFPERPKDVDELVDLLARRAAAGERLVRSLSAEQQEELAQLMGQALGGPLGEQLARLSEGVRALRPDLPWGRGEQLRGDQPLGYGAGTAVLDEVAELDALLDQLGQEHPGATLDDVDVEAVRRQLGRAAADDLGRLRELERELRRQGWLGGTATAPALSPKALRRLGSSALGTVFADLTSGRRGEHDLRSAGAAGERTGGSRAWMFGDEQPLDVVRTVSNAVLRTRPSPDGGAAGDDAARPGGGASTSVRLAVEDFEVVETERRATSAVALCVDLSFSMVSEGRWGPMKQTALALSHLVATRFPQDALQIIGFGRYAMPLSTAELAGVEPDYVQGTNLQHALRLARQHLRRHADADPVVLVVTDGEPTAHLAPDGRAEFCWPPRSETISATIREVDLLTRSGAGLNLFMLGEDPGLRRFMDAVARRSGGRVLTPSAQDLGQYVVADYLRARRRRR
jgi:uncharacterized protein with von Willebrand factor type A (vWA) domain